MVYRKLLLFKYGGRSDTQIFKISLMFFIALSIFFLPRDKPVVSQGVEPIFPPVCVRMYVFFLLLVNLGSVGSG